MYTRLHPEFADSAAARTARDIIGSCVHCGFCNATCPTYLELGDERDGPRGRIYLIRQILEKGAATAATRQHLDRCLTCRACETTCPSGVRYGALVDFGREAIEQRTRRPPGQRLKRWLIRQVVPYPRRFGALLRLGQLFGPLLPAALRARVPPRQSPGRVGAGRHSRRVVLLDGCAQSAATPATNAAASRVLDRLGITAVAVGGAGCCGAVSYHLSAHREARAFIRRNIDALRPALRGGAEHIVSTASGCGVMLKDYGEIMADDPDYADAAREVADKVVDLSELLAGEDLSALGAADEEPVALHCPCTLSHGLGLGETLRAVLQDAGVRLAETRDDHLCCGSAGTYSILQPGMSTTLLERKLDALTPGAPNRIATANIGCQMHLATRSTVPVQHWIELLDR
jgi:glycolate oxidase iron-sulfur subunit